MAVAQGFSKEIPMRAPTWITVGLLSLSLTACGGHDSSRSKSNSSSTTAPATTASVGTGTTTAGPPPELSVSTGPENKGLISSPAPAAGVVVGQIRLSANADVTLTELSITADGTVNESVGLGDVVTYVDANGNGALDAGDTQLGAGQAFATNNGRVVLSGLAEQITPASPLDVLLTTEVKSSANLSDTITFRVEGWRAVAEETATGTAVPVVGGGVSGSLQVIGTDPPKTLTVTKDSLTPNAAAGTADAKTIPLLVMSFTTTTGQLDLQALTFVTSGSGDDAVDVLEARLGKDANFNGVIDAGEVISTSRPDSDDGSLVFNFWGQRLSGSTSNYDLVVDYSLAGTASSGETFGLALKPSGVVAHAYYGNGGQSISVAQAPIQAAVLTVAAGSQTLSVQASGPAARTDAGGSEGVALILDLATGVGSVDLNSLTVSARGTVNDVTGVSQVGLYTDSDADGAFDPSVDAPFAPGASFSADDGSLSFAIPAGSQTLAGGSQTRLFVTVTLASGLPAGQSFSLTVDPTSDVTASQAVLGEVLSGTLLITGSGSSAFAQPGRDLGKDAYLRGEGLYLNDNYGSLGLAVGDRPTGQLGERLIYAEFPLPLSTAPVRAYVALYLNGTGGLTGSGLDVQVFRVVPSGLRTPWGEGRGGFDASMDGIVYDGTIQATNRPDLSHPDVDPAPLSEERITAGSEGRWVVFDVTAAAQDWYSGVAPNLGLRFRDKNFASHTDGQVGFYSSDTHKARLRPIFFVER